MRKLWNNYKKIIKLAYEHWVRSSLMEKYNYLKSRKYSVKKVVEEIKENLILILNEENETNNIQSNKESNKRDWE